MKNYTCFNYNFLFCDHFAKISNEARLYYIKLNFYADNGFVPNPLQVLDSLGYDKSVLNELVANKEILQLSDRCEVFISSYFVHNKGLKRSSWKATPYAVYWENKLYVKQNGIVDFAPEGLPKKEYDPLDKIEEPKEDATNNQNNVDDWDKMMNELNGSMPEAYKQKERK